MYVYGISVDMISENLDLSSDLSYTFNSLTGSGHVKYQKNPIACKGGVHIMGEMNFPCCVPMLRGSPGILHGHSLSLSNFCRLTSYYTFLKDGRSHLRLSGNYCHQGFRTQDPGFTSLTPKPLRHPAWLAWESGWKPHWQGASMIKIQTLDQPAC